MLVAVPSDVTEAYFELDLNLSLDNIYTAADCLKRIYLLFDYVTY